MSNDSRQSRVFFSPGATILVPLILGLAVLFAAVIMTYQITEGHREVKERSIDEKAQKYIRKSLESMRKGNYVEAEKAALQAVTLAEAMDTDRGGAYTETRATAYLFLGESQAGIGTTEKLGEALANLTVAIGLDPDKSFEYTEQVYYSRGQVNYRLGRNIEAEADFSQTIRIKPNFGNAYAARAYTRQKLGDREGAEADEKRARQLGVWPGQK